MRSPVRILDLQLVKNRGFRHGALAVSLRLGVNLWRWHQIRTRARPIPDEQDLSDTVEDILEEQVWSWLSDEIEVQEEDDWGFPLQSKEELEAQWNIRT